MIFAEAGSEAAMFGDEGCKIANGLIGGVFADMHPFEAFMVMNGCFLRIGLRAFGEHGADRGGDLRGRGCSDRAPMQASMITGGKARNIDAGLVPGGVCTVRSQPPWKEGFPGQETGHPQTRPARDAQGTSAAEAGRS